MVATDEGRVKFWPETSVERDGVMTFTFLSEPQPFTFKILEQTPPARFAFRYFGDTTVTFELEADGAGGTDLTMTETGFPSETHRIENYVGWLQVLLNLKAAADFGIDLRNHDPSRTWAPWVLRDVTTLWSRFFAYNRIVQGGGMDNEDQGLQHPVDRWLERAGRGQT